jgi:hypothetical protein
MISQLLVKCTRCGKIHSGMRHTVSMSLISEKEKESGAWESLANLNLTTNEVLCNECFNLFLAKFQEMNTHV